MQPSRMGQRLAQQDTTPNFECLITAFDDPSMKHLLVTLDDRGRERGGSDLAKQLPDIVASIQNRKTKNQQQHLAAAIKGKNLGEQEKLEALTEIIAQEKKRHQHPPH